MPADSILTALCFDYGWSYIGVAYGQTLTGTAQPLATLKAKQGQPHWPHVQDLLAQWQPQVLVVGIPLNMDGSDSEVTAQARRFGRRLAGRFALPVHEWDERLSSFAAKGELMQRNPTKRDFSDTRIDSEAARIIFESWAQQKRQDACF